MADRYRKVPVEVEAMQWDGTRDGASPIIEWADRNGAEIVYACAGEDGEQVDWPCETWKLLLKDQGA